eukprot:gnl/MRDRNA2_/MRDRNA2_129420_c0_seq1.p1 gnl/MRDRNA2_/MRDRNA2_129420_c0~~gnl/MRDRNA2_/MRDRNA2_129420_c0_seq1.p1  ORF type:complete len:198 (-),score=23.73 gnl/MRDRNA2_/MRDRNA2_129420_c0_seq1:89-682(-)
MLSLLLFVGSSAFAREIHLHGRSAARARAGNQTEEVGMHECLAVRSSTLPHAGKGLFATCNITSGASIGEYYGQVSEEPPADGTYAWRVPICKNSNFVVRQKNQKDLKECAPTGWRYVDAKEFPTSPEQMNPLRFANSIRSSELRGFINLKVHFRDGRVFYDVARDVHSGDELWIDYGQSYWKARTNKNMWEVLAER